VISLYIFSGIEHNHPMKTPGMYIIVLLLFAMVIIFATPSVEND